MNLKIDKKIKNSFSKHKNVIKGFIFALVALLGIYSFMLPISSEFCKTSLSMKIITVGSTICGIVFIAFAIITTINNGKNHKKYYCDYFYLSPILILEIINILTFFNYNLWGYKSPIIGLAIVYILLVESIASLRTLFKKSFGKENTPVLLIALATVSCFLALININAGNIDHAKLFSKFSFGIAYLVAIALYTNQFIYRPQKSEKTISNIIGIIFWGAIITISFPFYVQWCGLSGDNFETFVTVYAAVLGGGITLAGVAWTIIDGNDKRKEDLDRIELERKEEERKKYIPYIRLANEFQAHYAGRVNSVKHLSFDNPNEVSKIENNTYYAIMINPFTVKNVSESNIILKGIYLDNVYHPFDSEVLVERDSVGQIQFPLNHWYAFAKKISSVVLIITDIIGNKYAVSCDCYKRLDEQPVKSLAPDNQEYTVLSYTYTVESIALPKLIEEDSNE